MITEAQLIEMDKEFIQILNLPGKGSAAKGGYERWKDADYITVAIAEQEINIQRHRTLEQAKAHILSIIEEFNIWQPTALYDLRTRKKIPYAIKVEVNVGG